jgi:hypothetical protein
MPVISWMTEYHLGPWMKATTKKRYSDTTIQRYRNRNLEPEPGTGTWNRA